MLVFDLRFIKQSVSMPLGKAMPLVLAICLSCTQGPAAEQAAVYTREATAHAEKPSDEPYVPPKLRPVQGVLPLKLVYFVPTDREPIDQYRTRFGVIMSFVRDAFSTDLTAKGYRVTGPGFEFDRRGDLIVHLVRGTHKAAYYGGSNRKEPKGREYYHTIGTEVEKALGSRWENGYVILAETYDEKPAPVQWNGTIAGGAYWSSRGGVAMYSSWILRDDFCALNNADQVTLLSDRTPIPDRVAMGSKGTDPSPRNEFIEDGIGAIVHEIGHMFGLHHDRRDDHVLYMGNGFRELAANYDHDNTDPATRFSNDNAAFLQWSRFINVRVSKRDNVKPTLALQQSKPAVIGGTQLTISYAAEDNRAVAAIAWFDTRTHSVVGSSKLNGRRAQKGRVTLTLTEAIDDKAFDIRGHLTDTGGNVVETKLTIDDLTPAADRQSEK